MCFKKQAARILFICFYVLFSFSEAAPVNENLVFLDCPALERSSEDLTDRDREYLRETMGYETEEQMLRHKDACNHAWVVQDALVEESHGEFMKRNMDMDIMSSHRYVTYQTWGILKSELLSCPSYATLSDGLHMTSPPDECLVVDSKWHWEDREFKLPNDYSVEN